MKKLGLLATVLLVCGALVTPFFFSGCEDSPSTDINDSLSYSSTPRMGETARELTMTPNPVGISHVGQEVLMSVADGSTPFTWTVENNSAGTISAQANSRQAIYKALRIQPNVIYAQDVHERMASATVSASGSSGMSIIPSSVTMSNSWGRTIEFTVSGGVGPYSWNATLPGLGDITGNSGSQNEVGIYTVGGPGSIGVNTVTASDQAGAVATATVTQQ